jgi:cathepsin F
MKLIFALVLAFAILCSAFEFKGTSEEQFEQFKSRFNRNYKSPVEERIRFAIFEKNLARAQQLTAQSRGKTQYGINEFIDLSQEEFRETYLMQKGFFQSQPAPNKQFPYQLKNVTAPAAGQVFDWRFPNPKSGYNGNCISPVYNQGQCGSCWAFSATEQTESMTCLLNNLGNYIQNSMQQVVDCDTTSYGCSGGWTYSAYEYIEGAGGQDTYASYPYTAVNGQCAFKPSTVQSKISSWGWVGQNNEATMKNYILSTGPLSICVDAESWQYYNGGVVMHGSCGQSIDHCVQITGYGQQSGTNVWIVRNSWGTSWGYSGYLYVEYGYNVCGISDYPSTVAATYV